MTPDNRIRDERPEREMSEQDDPTLTTRVSRHGSTAEEARRQRKQNRQRRRSLLAESCSRSGGESRKNETGPSGLRSTLVARTTWTGARRFLVLGTAVVLCGFAFLALFSTSGAEKRAQDRRTKPSLGRPESAAQQAGASGIHDPAPQCRPRRRRSEQRATESRRHPGNFTPRTDGKPAAARAASRPTSMR